MFNLPAMATDYQNDREKYSSFGKEPYREERRQEQSAGRGTNAWSRSGNFAGNRAVSSGRGGGVQGDGSMRGNEYYGNAGYTNDYNQNRSADRPVFGAHAQGSYSGGTRYGEGGSTYGGGSSYGQSSYGDSGGYKARQEERDRNDRNRAENVRNGYGHPTDFGSRSYGSSDYSDYMTYNYGSRQERGKPASSAGHEQDDYRNTYGSYTSEYGSRSSSDSGLSEGSTSAYGTRSAGYSGRQQAGGTSAAKRGSYGNFTSQYNKKENK